MSQSRTGQQLADSDHSVEAEITARTEEHPSVGPVRVGAQGPTDPVRSPSQGLSDASPRALVAVNLLPKRGFEARNVQPATDFDVAFMSAALEQARAAEAKGEVPVGCVIVTEGSIVSRAHNLRETIQDPTAHAEILAMREAAEQLGTWRLSGTTAYVTLEPCPMCAGALVNARVDRVVYGADDPKAGATLTLYKIGSDARLNHRFGLTRGVLAEECGVLLTRFFAKIRAARRSAKVESLPLAEPGQPPTAPVTSAEPARSVAPPCEPDVPSDPHD